MSVQVRCVVKKPTLDRKAFLFLAIIFPLVALGMNDTRPSSPVTPAVLLFEPALFDGDSDLPFPDWIAGVGQAGGEVGGITSSWHVAESAPVGTGRLWIDLNRDALDEDMALSLVNERQISSVMIVQLLDEGGLVVASDLFGNIQSTAAEARTDTFVIPLLKYPNASRIVLRRISGETVLYGAALIPVVLEKDLGTNLVQALRFSRLLGDRLSPENELVRRVRAITGAGPSVVRQEKPPAPRAYAPVRQGSLGVNMAAGSTSYEEGQGDPNPETLMFGRVNWILWRTIFEVQGDKLLSRPVVRPGFHYGHHGNGRGPGAMTNIGNKDWKDYSVELDFCMSGVDPKLNPHGLPMNYRGGYIAFHVVDAAESWNERGGTSYNLSLTADGSWSLSCVYNHYCHVPVGYGNARNDGERQLANGKGLKLDPKNGNRFRIDVRGAHIKIWVDTEGIVDLRDEKMGDSIGGKTLDHGGVGIGGSHDCMIWIRNFSIKHL